MSFIRPFVAIVVTLWLYAPLAAADDALVVTHRGRSVQPGEVLELSVTAPAGVSSVTGLWRKRQVPFVRHADGAWRALIGVDVAETPGARTVRVTATPSVGPPLVTTYTLAVLQKTVRTRRITVDPKFVTPPKSALPRIQQETAILNALFRKSSVERLWTPDAVRPVEGVAVSGFGVRSILNGQPRSPHNGLDLAAGMGTPIHTPTPGVVVLARELYYSGNTVIVDHGQSMYSTMAHLSVIDVKEGDSVPQGALLGKSGATGRVTGPHLHWGVRLAGARVDPLSLVDVLSTSRRPSP